jgi:hypothetical protein
MPIDNELDHAERVSDSGSGPGFAHAPGRSSTNRLAPSAEAIARKVMRLMRRAEGTARDDNGVAAGADAAVATASGSTGAPLPADVRGRFEGSLGADLSGVRVHTGAESAAAANAVGARAYTIGNDIHFNAGQYAPTDPFGMHLLAHEVAHTVQQSGGAQRMQAKLEVSTPGDAAEVEADRAADAMVSGQQALVTGGEPAIQRTPLEGGAATDTELAQEIRRVMDNWLSHARTGVSQFVTADLSARITSLESGSWRTFLQTMVGGTVWCASAFLGPEAPALLSFGVQMVGMAIQGLTTLPQQSNAADALLAVETMFHRYLEDGHKHGVAQAAGIASRILADSPGMTMYRALARMMTATFKPTMLSIPGDFATIPQLDATAVRENYRDKGADTLARFRKQVDAQGTSVSGNDFNSNSVKTHAAIITGLPCGPRLAIVDTTQTVDPFPGPASNFITSWVDDDLRDAALDKLGRAPERIPLSKIGNLTKFVGGAVAAAQPRLTGLYKTNEGGLRIVTDRAGKVEGIYQSMNGNESGAAGLLVGTRDRLKIDGIWRQGDGKRRGTLSITFDPGLDSFTGTQTVDGEKGTPPYRGDRVG